MSAESLSGREIKKRIYDLLKSHDLDSALEQISLLPRRQVINPLFSFLYDKDQNVKWGAVKAIGTVVAELANEDMESARVVMRRLMWNLNDESGGIGWGSPEAMGEILSSDKILAKEYAPILLSYAREDGNFQEHELMQRGVIWGIGRLAGTSPDLVKDALPFLMDFLESPDGVVRGLTAKIMGLLRAQKAHISLESLMDDETEEINPDYVQTNVKRY